MPESYPQGQLKPDPDPKLAGGAAVMEASDKGNPAKQSGCVTDLVPIAVIDSAPVNAPDNSPS